MSKPSSYLYLLLLQLSEIYDQFLSAFHHLHHHYIIMISFCTPACSNKTSSPHLSERWKHFFTKYFIYFIYFLGSLKYVFGTRNEGLHLLACFGSRFTSYFELLCRHCVFGSNFHSSDRRLPFCTGSSLRTALVEQDLLEQARWSFAFNSEWFCSKDANFLCSVSSRVLL